MTQGLGVYIETYGCQMNVYDSERMAEAMGGEGYVVTDRADEADELTGFDREVEVIERDRALVEDLGDVLEANSQHPRPR